MNGIDLSKPTDLAPPALNAIYLRDGRYDEMTRDDVAKAFLAFSHSGKDRLALFFHGGLVSKKGGMNGAAQQYQAYHDVSYPYFFVWQAGIWEVLGHHLPSIFADTLFRSVTNNARVVVADSLNLPEATPELLNVALLSHRDDPLANVSLSEEQRASLSITTDDIDRFILGVTSDDAVRGVIADVARRNAATAESTRERVQPIVSSIRRGDNHYLNDITRSAVGAAYWSVAPQPVGATDAQVMALPLEPTAILNAVSTFAHLASGIFVNIVKRFRAGRDHGVVCTIVEEVLRTLYLARFGTSIWEEMKKETEDAFGADSSAFGGTAVIEEVCALIRARPSLKVTLVGHSTGAVYIGNFLRHVDEALTSQGDSSFTFERRTHGRSRHVHLLAACLRRRQNTGSSVIWHDG